jgi:hypothetical protein
MKKNNINSIKKLTSRIPKSINEAINFNDNNIEMESDEMDMFDDEQIDEPMDEPISKPEDSEMNADELINDIRKKALKAMANLADTPEDPNYEVLKKIFMMLDKAVSEKQEQREVIAKNPNAQGI